MTVTDTTRRSQIVETIKAMPTARTSALPYPGQCEQWQENQHDDDGCIEGWPTHFHRGMGDQFKRVHPVIRCLARSSFRRRRTFSTPTTASSDQPPMAMARPPSVMVLDRQAVPVEDQRRENRHRYRSQAITVGRKVPRKKNRMTATKTDAPISLPLQRADRRFDETALTERHLAPSGRQEDFFRSSSAARCPESNGWCPWRRLLDACDDRRFDDSNPASPRFRPARESHIGDLA